MKATVAHTRAPLVTRRDRRAVVRALRPGHGGIHGAEVSSLTREIADFTGSDLALTVNSGTEAIRCGLVAAGVGPGDQVITAAYGFVAAAMAAKLLGAKPVFADVRPDTGTIDPDQIQALITPKTKAIVPVSIHGIFCDSRQIESLADRFSLAVVWDHCQAIGSEDNGRRAGSTGTCSALSLNESKLWNAASEGGVFLTSSDSVHRAAALYACFGEDRAPLSEGQIRAYWSRYLGTNARLPATSAAIARSQLRRVDGYIKRGRANWSRLMSDLSDIKGVSFLQAPAGCLATPWQPLVLVDPAAYGWTGSEAEFRDRIVSELRRRELPVDTWQRHTLPEQAVFRRDQARAWHPGFVQTELAAPDGPYPVASRLVRRGFCVGMHPYPLHVQSSKVMRHYAEGFHAVFADMENVLHGTYTPRRPTPPIPAGDLWTSTSGAEASV